MKKLESFSLILIVMVLFSGCILQDQSITEVNPIGTLRQETLLIDKEVLNINGEDLHHYNITVELDKENHQLYSKQQVDYINNTQDTLEVVYFNLYPNAFKTKETAPLLFDNKIDSIDYIGGYIAFHSIEVNHKAAKYQVMGLGDNHLEILLEEPLLPGERVLIDMEYIVQIPNLQERFGVWEEVYNLGNWYPIAAVYDHKGWNLEPYYAIGDPFYSEVSNYQVTIILPEDMVLASSGNIINHRIEAGKGIWEIEAQLMRDFAWGASHLFEVEEVMEGDTVVKMYFLTKDPTVRREAMEYTANSLKTFNDIFGTYPYGYYSVMETNFPSGMEYPGLVLIGEQYYNRINLEALELVIVHETAHQWWYGVVGNDQINEAWLDESLATYSEVIYYREIYGDDQGLQHHKARNESSYEILKDQIDDKRVLRSLRDFDGWFDYGNLVYSQGARMIHDLENTYGVEKLYEILSTYYETHQFKVATTNDFIEVCEKILGKDKAAFFNKWLLDL